ncbi:MAG: repressor LexA [Candidatus Niyogibacteria bacterium CG10_big_fil_rev_8_21_14_0_10_42_19]|uniref:Repressor LexA n=1 Tax=Candidatus Niyogibacteria bacterium CG10_big_fil_rev_8_21_14_0_10_42_19 TaxID=1974725 RepID=A0A2H0TFE2_9BACT|nr:MAG: repressor LexA [Candidatus Niyogibacteria bacterium CG10_big_fil_rev_8_21_14_0_10_42_19]
MDMITIKQKRVLDYIKQYIGKNGVAPSLEEIQRHFKLVSVSTASYYINKLQKEGYLKKEAHQPRSITIQPDEVIKSILPKEIKSFSVPVLGAANAGPATLYAEENIEGYLKVSRDTLNRKEGIFALRVEGDSMNKAKVDEKNLEEGDFVLIDPGYSDPKNGDYVLSIIDGCANLKKFKRDEKTDQVMLISESTNPKHKPIFLSSDDNFMVNGKIVAVIKK